MPLLNLLCQGMYLVRSRGEKCRQLACKHTFYTDAHKNPTHTWPLPLTVSTHAHEHEGAGQLATQLVARMLFSTTGGSTLPSRPTHIPPLHYFYQLHLPIFLNSPPFFSSPLSGLLSCELKRVAFRFKLQVAICPTCPLPPICTQVSPEPAPMFTFPSPYLASSRSL